MACNGLFQASVENVFLIWERGEMLQINVKIRSHFCWKLLYFFKIWVLGVSYKACSMATSKRSIDILMPFNFHQMIYQTDIISLTSHIDHGDKKEQYFDQIRRTNHRTEPGTVVVVQSILVSGNWHILNSPWWSALFSRRHCIAYISPNILPKCVQKVAMLYWGRSQI